MSRTISRHNLTLLQVGAYMSYEPSLLQIGKPNINENKDDSNCVVATKNLGCSQRRPLVAMGIVHPWIKHALRWFQCDSCRRCIMHCVRELLSWKRALRGVDVTVCWIGCNVIGVAFLKGLWCRLIRGWHIGCQTSPIVRVHICVCVRDIGERRCRSGFWRRVNWGHETHRNRAKQSEIE